VRARELGNHSVLGECGTALLRAALKQGGATNGPIAKDEDSNLSSERPRLNRGRTAIGELKSARYLKTRNHTGMIAFPCKHASGGKKTEILGHAAAAYFFNSKTGLAGLRRSYTAKEARYLRASSSTLLLAICKLDAFSTHTDFPSAKTL
jgi:hypothetical protein